MTEAIYLEVSEKTYATIKANRQVSVSGILKILGVSRSGYRVWQNRKNSSTQQRREAAKAKIMVIYDDSKQNYGFDNLIKIKTISFIIYFKDKYCRKDQYMYNKYIKRLLDLLLSIIALFLFSWLFLVIFILVKLSSKGPLFFKQERVGLHKSYFNIIKFRTMRVGTPSDIPTHLLVNPDQYITPIGKFLRRTSLDELPQLFNIIKGDMSIVGPRPALWNQFDLVEERDKYNANDVRPGLTGWAQINGRDELPILLKAKLDGEYIRKMSFIYDVKCIICTVRCVIIHEGVREGGQNIKDEIAH